MKLIHLSDLHLGKRVNEFPMTDDQKYILGQILSIVDSERPDAVIIAGDVYDKSVPPAEAVELFDDFLVKLSGRGVQTFIISGNHDSAERLAFGGRLMDVSGVHISPAYNGEVTPYELKDEHGTVRVYLLPFIKPAHVRRFFPDEEPESYTDAVGMAIAHMEVDTGLRNVLVTHQFVTGASRSDSEEVSVGGTDNVDASVFEGFDYVALGHIHGPQNVGSDTIRYCGTPLKYSFSESGHKKSVTIVELGKKGDIAVRTVELRPLRDLVELRGKYNDLMLKSFYENTTYEDDYVHITLTDEADVPDAITKLRSVYKKLMKLDYDNSRTAHTAHVTSGENVENKSPSEIFAELFEKQNGAPPTEEQTAFLLELTEKIWEEQV